jgi:hypothetical protein
MKLLRAETLDRCHFKRNVEGGHYYVCEEHEFEYGWEHMNCGEAMLVTAITIVTLDI